jgi:spore maturation protein CgeB
MAEIILRGKAGPPVVRREGTAVIVKKRIWGASVEERTAGTRITGKQSVAATAMHTTAELQASFKGVETAVATAVAKADAASHQFLVDQINYMAKKAKDEGIVVSAKNVAEMKAAAQKIAHIANKLAAAKANGKTKTQANVKLKADLKEVVALMKGNLDKHNRHRERRAMAREEATS